MPDFRLRDDCRHWFRRISDKAPFRVLFDSYYLCMTLGLAGRQFNNPAASGSEVRTFVDSFPKPYDSQDSLIIGLLVDAELEKLGVRLTDRQSVNRVVNDVAGPGGLTNYGASLLNGYASGGFDYLIGKYDDGSEPRSVEDFMPRYLRILGDVPRNVGL